MIVLGSTSKYRAKLLSRLNLGFLSANPIGSETPVPGEQPQALAERLAAQKAHSLRDAYPKQLIIGSDQVAALENQLLGKPGTHESAVAQLTLMQGHCVRFFTSVCLLNAATGDSLLHTNITQAKLRTLTEQEIERYLLADLPYDCAGSFKVESLGISLFEWVKSDDPTGLEGLPLIALTKQLRHFGVHLP